MEHASSLAAIDRLLGLGADGFVPHGHCYLWQPGVLLLNVGSDFAIFVAYLLISAGLIAFVRRRRDLDYPLLVALFGSFILACGITHLFEVWVVWFPDYWVSGAAKLVTAVVSLVTAFMLYRLMPALLAIPSPSAMAAASRSLSELSTHLQRVQETERAGVARELHDELGGHLTGLSLDLAKLARQLAEGSPEAPATLERARKLVEDTQDIKRRVIESLRPSMLDQLGLAAAIDAYAGGFRQRSELEVDLDLDPDVEFATTDPALDLYRIMQEALTNVAKHARARRVRVRLARENGTVVLSVRDDGRGIASTEDKAGSHGLRGMRHRMLRWGGSVDVSSPPEGGTEVVARMPAAATA
jgi:signal transduction histidine kinase